MAGFVADLPAAIAAFDVALYAAFESEGMSRVLFEYLAMGKPVVATRVGVVPEVLEDGRTALLVPADEPGPLTEAIERLLDDAGLRARLGAAGERARPRAPLGRRGGARPRRALRAARRGGRPRDAVKISVLCFDLADNAAGRAYLLARLLEPLGEVEVVGPASRRRHLAAGRGRGRALPLGAGRGGSPGFAASLRGARAAGRRRPALRVEAAARQRGRRAARARARADGRSCSTWTTGRSASSSAAASGERSAGASTSPTRRACRGRG